MFYFQSHTVVDSFYTIVIITCILTVQQDLSLLWKAMWINRQVVKYILISFLTFSSFSNFHHDYKHVIIFTSIDLKVHVHKIMFQLSVIIWCYVPKMSFFWMMIKIQWGIQLSFVSNYRHLLNDLNIKTCTMYTVRVHDCIKF